MADSAQETPPDSPRLDDPIAHVDAQIRRRLAAIGCTVHAAEHTFHTKGSQRLKVDYSGRNEQGHLALCTIRLEARPGETLAVVEQRIERHMRAPEKRHALAGGIDPVVPSPTMPLSHLEISMPYARRLRIDHGDRAQDALREAIMARLAENARTTALKSQVPNQPSFSNHRIDHREQLGEGVWLRGHNLVVANTTLPHSLAMSLPGRCVTAVCEHPVLGETETIRRLEMTNVDREEGKRTVTFMLETGWIRADEI